LRSPLRSPIVIVIMVIVVERPQEVSEGQVSHALPMSARCLVR
jgi:hypothetical protein